MNAEAPTFSIDTDLYPLNAIWEFPEDKRRHVLTTLEVTAYTQIPSESELHLVRQEGSSSDELAIEKRYGHAANVFATAIEPDFDPVNWDRSSLETQKLRGMFYKMIRTLSQEQILRGLETLKRIG